MQHKDKKLRFPDRFPTGSDELFSFPFDVLLELAHGVLERSAGVVDLVHDQDVLADQAGHLQRGQIEPLRARDFGAGLLDRVIGLVGGCGCGCGCGGRGEGFIEGEPNGLDGDIGC